MLRRHLALASLCIFAVAPALATSRHGTRCTLLRRVVELQAIKEIEARTPDPPDDLAAHLPASVAAVPFRTSDGHQLAGYRIACGAGTRGFLLVAQGDAMLASSRELLESLRDDLCQVGVDIYLFDYRGTGSSRGATTRNLEDVIDDYRELGAYLSSLHPQPARRFLYGVSAGGLILLNALGTGNSYDALVLDSTPDDTGVGCWNQEYAAADHVPRDSSRLLLLASKADETVNPGEVKRIASRISAGAGSLALDTGLPHFDKDSQAQRSRRLRMVADFFNERSPRPAP